MADNILWVKIKNIILNIWDSSPNNLIAMKKFTNDLLTIFVCTDSYEIFFFFLMNFIKCTYRNKLRNELVEKCVKVMSTKYEYNIKKLQMS